MMLNQFNTQKNSKSHINRFLIEIKAKPESETFLCEKNCPFNLISPPILSTNSDLCDATFVVGETPAKNGRHNV